MKLAAAALKQLGSSSSHAKELADAAWRSTWIPRLRKLERPLSSEEYNVFKGLHTSICAPGLPNLYFTEGALVGRTMSFVLLWRSWLFEAAEHVAECGDEVDKRIAAQIIACMSGEPAVKRRRLE